MRFSQGSRAAILGALLGVGLVTGPCVADTTTTTITGSTTTSTTDTGPTTTAAPTTTTTSSSTTSSSTSTTGSTTTSTVAGGSTTTTVVPSTTVTVTTGPSTTSPAVSGSTTTTVVPSSTVTVTTGPSTTSTTGTGSSSTTTTVTATTSTTVVNTTSTTLLSCGSSPASGCQPAAAQQGRLQLGKGKLKWNWTSSATVTGEDLGNPTRSTDYTLCIYDATGRKLSALAPADATCGKRPCWNATGTTGFAYRDRDGMPDGLTQMRLRWGGPAHAKMQAKDAGSNLQLPMLALTKPVKVQLLRSDSSVCWEATFSSSIRDDPAQFKAKSD